MTKEEIKTFADDLLEDYDDAAPSLDRLIRLALENIILAVAPDAVTFAYNSLRNKPEEWANFFQTRDETNRIQDVHGWVIRRAQLTSEEYRLNSDKTIFAYDVWGFKGFYVTSDSDNSDDTFQRTIDKISYVVKKLPRLGFGECTVESQPREMLQFDEITALGEGDEQLHFAAARILVHLCPGKF